MASISYGLGGFTGLSKFRDDLRPTTFRAFLLGNGIVGTLKRGLTAITAWLETVAANLYQFGWHLLLKVAELSYLPAVAGVTGTL